MIFKVCRLLNENKVCEAQEFISSTLNKLLSEEKYSLIDLILLLFLKNKTIPKFIYCQLLELTAGKENKLPNRKKMEDMLDVCE